MPRRRRRRSGYEEGGGHFVMLPDYMTNSETWRRLSFKAVWVYIEMKKKFFGNNQNNLSLTYREVKWKLASASFSMAIQELVEYGFIKIVRPGGLFRSPTLYGLEKRWEHVSKNPETLAEIEEKLRKLKARRQRGRRGRRERRRRP